MDYTDLRCRTPAIAAAKARPRNPFCSLPPVAAPSDGRMSVPAGSAPGTHHAHSEPDRGWRHAV